MSEPREMVALNPWYIWIRGRQFEGTYPGDSQTGIWPITGARVAYGLGFVPQSAWPYNPPAVPWPPLEPDGLDEIAKKHRTTIYQRVRSLSDCKNVLANRDPVMAAFEITAQWFDAYDGKIALPNTNDVIVGSHAVCVIDINESDSEFIFVNSWGDRWGHRGFGYLPFSYFDERIVSAWTSPIAERRDEVTDFTQYLQLGFRTSLGDMVHVREVYDSTNDERLAWAISVERPPFLDIEDCFVRPQWRGQGLGRGICEMLRAIINERKLQPRVWFSHADEDGPIERHLCESLGLSIGPSGVRWAKYLATSENISSNPTLDLTKPAIWFDFIR